MIAAIVAMDRQGLIGNKGALPWHYKEDLSYFKETTLNHTVLMGRLTYESIVKQLGKALPKRTNVVVSNTLKALPDANVVHDLKAYLNNVPKNATLFVIGGAQIYQQSLAYCDRLYITHIEAIHEGDTYFPALDWSMWKCLNKKTQGPLTFAVYERVTPWQQSSTL